MTTIPQETIKIWFSKALTQNLKLQIYGSGQVMSPGYTRREPYQYGCGNLLVLDVGTHEAPLNMCLSVIITTRDHGGG